MTDGELKDIERNYNSLISIKRENVKIQEAIELYEQTPEVRHYLELKQRLENNKGYSFYEIEKLTDDQILEKVLNDLHVSNTNNIYVYMGTYKINNNKNEDCSEDFLVSYDDTDADYRMYISIELNQSAEDYVKMIPCSQSACFEEENIVLYPIKCVNKTDYYMSIRHLYFQEAIKYGQEKAVEKVLYRRNMQKRFKQNID